MLANNSANLVAQSIDDVTRLNAVADNALTHHDKKMATRIAQYNFRHLSSNVDTQLPPYITSASFAPTNANTTLKTLVANSDQVALTATWSQGVDVIGYPTVNLILTTGNITLSSNTVGGNLTTMTFVGNVTNGSNTLSYADSSANARLSFDGVITANGATITSNTVNAPAVVNLGFEYTRPVYGTNFTLDFAAPDQP